MIEDSYEFEPISPLGRLFTFESIGRKGRITKAVHFKLVSENRFNLGLADFENGRFEYERLSENEDSWKVLNTVARITLHFAAQNPTFEIQIRADEPKRLRLYNTIFRHYQTRIAPHFSVFGLLKTGGREVFNPNHAYVGFILKSKTN